jgi:hypothetical protein
MCFLPITHHIQYQATKVRNALSKDKTARQQGHINCTLSHILAVVALVVARLYHYL